MVSNWKITSKTTKIWPKFKRNLYLSEYIFSCGYITHADIELLHLTHHQLNMQEHTTWCRLRAVGCHVRCLGTKYGVRCFGQGHINQQFLCWSGESNWRGFIPKPLLQPYTMPWPPHIQITYIQIFFNSDTFHSHHMRFQIRYRLLFCHKTSIKTFKAELLCHSVSIFIMCSVVQTKARTSP